VFIVYIPVLKKTQPGTDLDSSYYAIIISTDDLNDTIYYMVYMIQIDHYTIYIYDYDMVFNATYNNISVIS